MLFPLFIVLGWTEVGGSKFFVSKFPEEADYQSQYPTVSLGFYLKNDAHVLPYLFGFVENLEYPKDRISIDVYVDKCIDATLEKVKWWLKEVSWLYRNTQLTTETENWREEALRKARISRANYVFLYKADHFFVDTRILQHLIAWEELTVAPALLDAYGEAFHMASDKYAVEETSKYSRNSTTEPLFIKLSHADASYLTFSAENLLGYDGRRSPLAVFLESLSRTGASAFLDDENFYGYNLNPAEYSLETRRKQMNYFIANIIAGFGLSFVHTSSSIEPQYPRASLFKMNKVYVVNLERRKERRRKMKKIMKLLGFEYQLWTATDGNSLKLEPLFKDVTFLPGYEDPFYKRPMKAGEIGCFFSHYRIWQEVVEKKFERVIVFEDDLRFDLNSTTRLQELVEDLDAKQFVWDLIYLGRKQMESSKEHWVTGVRHLSTVGYSYWTIGYMLSQAGAQKLLSGNPLENLIPVDEYIPLMYDSHPNSTWKQAFPNRNLVAFAVYPTIVQPEKYTHDDGYVSDTEGSDILLDTKQSSSVESDLDTELFTTLGPSSSRNPDVASSSQQVFGIGKLEL